MHSAPPPLRDYKHRASDRPQGTPPLHPLWHLSWILLTFAGAALLTIGQQADALRHEPPPQATAAISNDKLPEPEALSAEWREITIQQGQSLASIFAQLHLAPRILHDIMHSTNLPASLRSIKPGEILRFQTRDDTLLALHYQPDPAYRLEINYVDGAYSFAEINRQHEKRTQIARGTIKSSLFQDAKDAGLPDGVIMQLAYVFGWDIDFALDIRDGDRFTVVYQELLLDGRKVRDGDILAAEFINNGETLRALRYTDPDGNSDYYAPDGKNLRKTFLRTPVDFTRISSFFGQRKHPILNRMRVHQGVDYAAPRGTAVKTTGSGKIIFRGIKGGYGNTVIVRHGDGYRTLYAHLQQFQRQARLGGEVQQGQVIGFVGSSGLATGPHLHYEFLINNVHRNPLRVPLPDARPVSAEFAADFRSTTLGLNALLDIINDDKLALASPARAEMHPQQ